MLTTLPLAAPNPGPGLPTPDAGEAAAGALFRNALERLALSLMPRPAKPDEAATVAPADAQLPGAGAVDVPEPGGENGDSPDVPAVILTDPVAATDAAEPSVPAFAQPVVDAPQPPPVPRRGADDSLSRALLESRLIEARPMSAGLPLVQSPTPAHTDPHPPVPTPVPMPAASVAAAKGSIPSPLVDAATVPAADADPTMPGHRAPPTGAEPQRQPRPPIGPTIPFAPPIVAAAPVSPVLPEAARAPASLQPLPPSPPGGAFAAHAPVVIPAIETWAPSVAPISEGRGAVLPVIAPAAGGAPLSGPPVVTPVSATPPPPNPPSAPVAGPIPGLLAAAAPAVRAELAPASASLAPPVTPPAPPVLASGPSPFAAPAVAEVGSPPPAGQSAAPVTPPAAPAAASLAPPAAGGVFAARLTLAPILAARFPMLAHPEPAAAEADLSDVARPDASRLDPARFEPPRPGLTLPPTVARQIAEAIPPADSPGFDLSLSPEELGQVRLRLIGGEAGGVLMIYAERPETLDLLRRHIGTLEQDLRDLGHEGLELRFSSSDGGDSGTHRGHRPSDAPALAPAVTAFSASEPRDAAALNRVSPGVGRDHLDLRL